MNLPVSIPPFILDENYSKLTPKQGHKRYRYVTKKDFEMKFKEPIIPKNSTIHFMDNQDRIWAKIKHDTLIISKDYAWDGCTPKKWSLGIWWGTPDFKETILPSLVHDILCQFQDTEHFPFYRDYKHRLFKYMLEQQNFKLSELYFWGVEFGETYLSDKNYQVKSLMFDDVD